MKIYTQTYDLAKASPHRFWVAPFSEFKIGIKILEKDEISSKDFTLKAGSTEFTPDPDKIDNFTLFTIKSNDTGFVDYTIEVEGVAEKLKLMQIVTDSTVFEIDAGGSGDVPADVATQTWVNSQISDFITDDALDGYATENYVDSAISDFVEEGELTAYATKDELTSYAETADLTAYAEKTDLTAYATKDELTSYAETADLTAYAEKTDLIAFYTKSETSSATEINTALDGKQPTGDYALTSQIPTVNDGTLTILQGGIEKGTFTANQTGNVSVELDAGGGDMSNYYTKSETSSATEINTALDGKQPAGNYLTAETDPSFNTWLSGETFGIGYHTQTGVRAIAVGYATNATGQYSVAIGAPNCRAGANGAIQLGQGSNNIANTFNVFNYQMLSSDGKIPNERLHLSAVSESDWATLSGSADAGTFYFVY